MSKRAEEAALKRFPEEMTRIPYQDLIEANGGKEYVDFNSMPRGYFQLGYEQAEKDLGWHPATEHPPVDEEVIVLVDNIPIYPTQFINKLDAFPIYKIAFGHMVNIEYCKDYDGWNIPGVKYWMPMPKLPKEDEK